jgi:hypothetical protein
MAKRDAGVVDMACTASSAPASGFPSTRPQDITEHIHGNGTGDVEKSIAGASAGAGA